MSLRDGSITLSTRFMGSLNEYHYADMVMVGVPMDYTCSFRPGTRFGPQKIREVSIGIEDYSPYQDKSLEDSSFYDAGDLDLPMGNVERSIQMIGDAAGEILDDGKFPLFLGGEHLISTPVIQKVYEKYGDELVVIHLDAHADLREGYLGCQYSHASAIRRICDFMPAKNIYQFGIRSGTRDEFQFGRTNTNFYPFEVLEPLKAVIPTVGARPVYLTIDIDVVDPAFVNGTGTPEPGGISSKELLDSIMAMKDLNIVGFDLVEISPPFDASERSAVFGAKIVRELILLKQKNGGMESD